MLSSRVGRNRSVRIGLLAAVAGLGLSLASAGLNNLCPPEPIPVPVPGDDNKDCPFPDKCHCTNSPVFVRTGVPTFGATDLVVGGPGLPLAVSRQYLGSSRYVGMLGIGWITPFEEHLSEETDGTNCRVTLLLQDGRTTYFSETPCDSGSFASDEGYPWTLARNVPAAGMWTLFLEDGTEHIFDSWGCLDGIAGPEGDSLQFTYDGGHRLASVTDPLRPQRYLYFAFDANGFLDTVVHQVGGAYRQVTYSRDAVEGNLVAVRTPGGRVEALAYKPTTEGVCREPHLIESVVRSIENSAAEFPPVESSRFSADHRLLAKTEAGRSVTYEYLPGTDPEVLQSITRETWTDTRGVAHEKRLTVDPTGRITSIEHFEGGGTAPIQTEVFLYGGVGGRLEFHRDPSGRWTRTQYDGLGHPTAITRAFCDGSEMFPCSGSPTNQTWTYTYGLVQGVSGLTAIGAPAGFASTQMEHYASTDPAPEGGVAGKLWRLKRVNEDGSTDVQAAYVYVTTPGSASFGLVKRLIDGTGAVTAYGYDGSGALTSVQVPDNNLTGRTVTYMPDAFYQVAQVTDQAGSVTEILYDGAGRTSAVRPPHPTTGQPSALYGTVYGYDEVVPAATLGVDTDFDGVSDPLLASAATDGNGRVSRRYTDMEGRVWAVEDAAGGMTRYDYYRGGFLRSILDANDNRTEYAYDALDRLERVTDPMGGVVRYGYFADGRLQSRTDAKGQTVTYAYDNLNRLTGKTYGALGSVTFTYIGDRVATVTDTYHPRVSGQTQAYAYGYDARRRVTSVATPTGTVSYTHESPGSDRIGTLTDGTRTWAYAYYPDGSLWRIEAPEGDYVYTYNAVGQVAGISYPDGSSAQHAYDLQHRLTQVLNIGPGDEALSETGYGYDLGLGDDGRTMRGMISGVTERVREVGGVLHGPMTTQYGYDRLYRLVRAVYPPELTGLGAPWGNQTHEWIYDAIGNRKAQVIYDNTTGDPIGKQVYTYNLKDVGPHLVSVSAGDTEVTYAYDANGNLVLKTDGATKLETEYTWDMDDRMTESWTEGMTSGTYSVYAYNGDRLSRRVATSLFAVSTTYLYDREDILRASRDGGPTHLTHGPGIDDALAAQGGTGVSYLYKNLLGSVLQETRAGQVTRRTSYDAWGTASPWPSAMVQNVPYAYTGREWDDRGVYYYRNRFYTPEVGRFISVDPLVRKLWFLASYHRHTSSIGLIPYVYVGQRPIGLLDPFGLQASGPGGSGGSCCCEKLSKRGNWIKNEVIPSFILTGTWPPSAEGIAGTSMCGGEMPPGQSGQVNDTDPCTRPCVLQHEAKHSEMCRTLGSIAYSKLSVSEQEVPALNEELECLMLFCKAKGCEGCP